MQDADGAVNEEEKRSANFRLAIFDNGFNLGLGLGIVITFFVMTVIYLAWLRPPS